MIVDWVFCYPEIDPKQKIVLSNEHCLFLQLEDAEIKGKQLEGAGLIVPIHIEKLHLI